MIKRNFLMLLLSWGALTVFAQTNWNNYESADIVSRDSIVKNGFTLLFINKDSALSSVTKQRMIDAFFTVYPLQVERFNKEARNKVIFVVDPEYKGVAAAANGIIRYSPKWLREQPEDIDVVTHEVMHVVQSYPRGAGPGWLTEGIADYVRYRYGINNPASKWSLTPFKENHSYTNSYRITARFLVWLETKKNDNLVNELDNAMRTKSYTPEIWNKLAGNSLDELWQEYAGNPAI